MKLTKQKSNISSKKVTVSLLSVFLLFIVFFVPTLVFAEENPVVKLEVGIGSMYIATGLVDYILAVYQFLVGAIAILSAVIIMASGVRWAAAAGNSGEITKAKEGITNALIGLVLALTSYLILYTINPNLVDLSMISIPTPKVPPIEDLEKNEAPILPTDPSNPALKPEQRGVCKNEVGDDTCTGLVDVNSLYTQKNLSKAVHKLSPNAAAAWDRMAEAFYIRFGKKVPANHMFRSYIYQECLYKNNIGDHPSQPKCTSKGHISGGAVDINISSLTIAQYNWLACENEKGCEIIDKSKSGYNSTRGHSSGWKVLNYNKDFNPAGSNHNHITEDHHFDYTGSTSVNLACPQLEVCQ